ncbi:MULTISPECIES: EF-hand domain-containing protein [unclassified Streptomyces]|uniref:EF-hand domain-containing protein n=1 Tax=unclassified Streptomyces TaxID=2593676 RepID=UPI00039D4679|nr:MULTISPECIES: EF-hand domain-containing protein [unclassified Streptomyces]MYT33311.1 EF-hand domain-containing protein [Streptomyces sp. SID8354]
MTETEAKELFDQIDTDRDGQINIVELANHFKREGHQGKLKEKVKAALEADANHDRVIDFNEFQQMVK